VARGATWTPRAWPAISRWRRRSGWPSLACPSRARWPSSWRRRHEGSGLSDRHKLAIRWTDAFLGDAGAAAADDLRAAMLREFTPEEIVELTAGLALFQGFAKIAVALGEQPESMLVTVIPTPDRS
jgi:alkylhydroperoxidase family enzyme